MVCPCGCGEIIQLSLIKEDNPMWRIVKNDKNQITVSPSIWRTKNCRSHYFLRDSKIVWAEKQSFWNMLKNTLKHFS